MRDDFTGFLNKNGVARPYVFALNFVLVVEGGAGNKGTRQVNGLKNRNRGHGAGAPHLHVYFPEDRFGALGLKFVSDRAAWSFGSATRLFLLRDGIQLDNGSVGGIGKVLPPLIEFFNTGPDRIDPGTGPEFLKDRAIPCA